MNTFSTFVFATLLAISNNLYISGDNVYVGTFAICKDTCTNSCGSGYKCIEFRDNTGNKNIESQPLLAEQCWKIQSCAEFPKFYAFQTDNECEGKCEMNIFPGFSLRSELNNNVNLYKAKGYNMMCIEYMNKDTPMPNICSIAKTQRRR